MILDWKINTVKISILLKMIYKFNIILIKIPFSTEIDKNYPKICMEP